MKTQSDNRVTITLKVVKRGIKVNCVAPGPVQTGWIDEELANAVLPQIPLGKLIQPQDIADTIVFLASERAAMITGQVIKVSGGHASRISIFPKNTITQYRMTTMQEIKLFDRLTK